MAPLPEEAQKYDDERQEERPRREAEDSRQIPAGRNRLIRHLPLARGFIERLAVAMALMGITGCGPSTSGDPEAGASLYAQTCATCHGEDGLEVTGAGDSAHGKNLRARLEEISDRAIERAVLEGVGEMDPLSLSPQEVADVIAFLREERWDDD
jgi:mono/diheme cytochrome c family protein